MIFPSFCIRRSLHALRILCPFCVHKNSVNEIQHEISPTLSIIEPFFFVFVNFNLNENRAYKVAENFKNLCVIVFTDKNYSLIPLT